VIEEIDWSVGVVANKLKEHGLEKNTLLVFTSDNGPWLVFETDGGSAGLLRSGKGCTYEGGMREPCIFWWPGMIEPAVIADMGSTLDLFPTISNLAGIEVPSGRMYDGFDLSPVLFGGKDSPREQIIYYDGQRLFAIRDGKYKAHFTTRENVYESNQHFVEHETPLLFDLEMDPGENYNIAGEHPEIIERLRSLAEEHKKTVKPVPNQLDTRVRDLGTDL
jgi:arylsulfatase A-like enzyme